MVPISTQLAPKVKVNFVLPLQDGSPHLKEFMQMFEQVCDFQIIFCSFHCVFNWSISNLLTSHCFNFSGSLQRCSRVIESNQGIQTELYFIKTSLGCFKNNLFCIFSILNKTQLLLCKLLWEIYCDASGKVT